MPEHGALRGGFSQRTLLGMTWNKSYSGRSSFSGYVCDCMCMCECVCICLKFTGFVIVVCVCLGFKSRSIDTSCCCFQFFLIKLMTQN